MRYRGSIFFALAGLAVLLGEFPALAGGGPENLALVINRRSWASRKIANHYAELRFIPPRNMIYLDWPGSVDRISSEEFREKILKPVLTELDRRRISHQIDYVVYSTDFPFSVDLADELGKEARFAHGSLTGLTYLAPVILARRREVAGMNINWYYRPLRGKEETQPTHGFRSRYLWGKDGEIVEEQGQRYLLSTMLAYTAGRGNSVDEALRYLRRSARADSTFPDGVIYYVDNKDVRAATRRSHFQTAIDLLAEEGVAAEIVQGRLPVQKPDVMGAMIGFAAFSWPSAKSDILPGAIVEHLTSFGGILSEGAGQTPLSEFLRYGAAGASGTVVEPFAIQAKFPHPLIHVHYARGCTLAEAFFQSVYGPYQLLVVGDPLCRPWARPPMVQAPGVTAGAQVSGALKITPSVVAGGPAAKAFHLFLDGQLVSEIVPGKEFELDTTALPDGYHELRIVAIDDTPIETQGRLILPIHVNNRDQAVTVRTRPERRVPMDGLLEVAAVCPGAVSLALLQHQGVLGQAAGSKALFRVDPRQLGEGPTQLTVFATGEGGKPLAVSEPIRIETLPATPIPANAALAGRPKADGMLVTRGDGTRDVVSSTLKTDWPARAGVTTGERFTLESVFHAGGNQVHQFVVGLAGSYKLRIDGVVIGEGSHSEFERDYLPVNLTAGWRRLEMEADLKEAPCLLRHGGPTPDVSLSGKQFQHVD